MTLRPGFVRRAFTLIELLVVIAIIAILASLLLPALAMAGKGPAANFPNFPASYHNGAGGLSFADGHAEIKKWLDRRTKPPKRKGVKAEFTPSPNNPDIAWLQERTTSLK